MEWLMTGNATAKLLDFFVTYKDFDYSETDIAELARVSPKTVLKEIPKLESTGLIKYTRKVGRAKMFKLNMNSDAAKLLDQLIFTIASKRINDVVNNAQPIQQTIEEINRTQNPLESKL